MQSSMSKSEVVHAVNDSLKDAREDSRFRGLAGAIQANVDASVVRHLGADNDEPFVITPEELAHLSNERTRAAFADVLAAGVQQEESNADPEAPTSPTQLCRGVLELAERL